MEVKVFIHILFRNKAKNDIFCYEIQMDYNSLNAVCKIHTRFCLQYDNIQFRIVGFTEFFKEIFFLISKIVTMIQESVRTSYTHNVVYCYIGRKGVLLYLLVTYSL